MNNIGASPIVQSLQSTPSYSPIGKPAVGLESPDSKDQTLPPVEESSGADRLREQKRQRTGAASGDGRHGKHQQDDAELPTEAEAQAEEATAAQAQAAQNAAPMTVPTPLQMALQRVAALATHPDSHTNGGAATEAFNSITDDKSAPGAILDRRV